MAHCQVNMSQYQSISYFTLRHKVIPCTLSCIASVLRLCIIHHHSLAAETQTAQANKINILPVLWQRAMHQILACAQRIILLVTRELLVSGHNVGEVRATWDCWVMTFLIWCLSQWPTRAEPLAKSTKHSNSGLSGTLSSLCVETFANWWR